MTDANAELRDYAKRCAAMQQDRPDPRRLAEEVLRLIGDVRYLADELARERTLRCEIQNIVDRTAIHSASMPYVLAHSKITSLLTTARPSVDPRESLAREAFEAGWRTPLTSEPPASFEAWWRSR